MALWNWWVLAVVLLATELLLIDAQFYLVFLGVAAACVGLVMMGMPLTPVEQWLLFGALSVVALLWFRKRIYQQLRQPHDAVPDVLVMGDKVELREPLSPGHSTRVEYHGTTWSARNIDSDVLQGEVAIVKVEGLTLLVKRQV